MTDRSRIVVLYANHVNTNPTYTRLPIALGRVTGGDCFTLDVNASTLSQVRDVLTGAAAVVVDQSLMVAKNWTQRPVLSTRVHLGLRDKSYYAAIDEMVLATPVRRAFLASGSDLHWPGFEPSDLIPRYDGLIWLYTKFPAVARHMPAAHADDWMGRHPHPTELWAAYARIPTQIEMTHAIAPPEFCRVEGWRPFDLAIPGQNYATRQIAKDSAAGIPRAPYGEADAWITRIARGLPFSWERRSRWMIAGRTLSQRYQLALSKVAFVCGSGYGYPVRKFFEVPASGAAMVAAPCTGMADFGFEDGIHYSAARPEDAGESIRRLLKDDDLRLGIARQAAALVRERHSVAACAARIVDALRRFAVGEQFVAEHIQGTYVIRSRGADFDAGTVA
jgi:hypothetical protein